MASFYAFAVAPVVVELLQIELSEIKERFEKRVKGRRVRSEDWSQIMVLISR